MFTWTSSIREYRLQTLAEMSAKLAWRQASRDASDLSSTRTHLALGGVDVPRPGFVFPIRGVNLQKWAHQCGLGVPVGAETVLGACSAQVAGAQQNA